MIDLIVFSVGNNRYALNIENIQRIIQSKNLTDIPNTSDLIDGMMSYEESVIKVLNFRKLIGLSAYDDELKKLFDKLINVHVDWIESFKYAIDNDIEFKETTNPHKCELGVWLDSFNSYDDEISLIINSLIRNHKNLHSKGAEILEVLEKDKSRAQEMLKTELLDIFTLTMSSLESFVAEIDTVANSLQKLILYEKNDISFAIKVDSIEDIAHIEESIIMNSSDEHNLNEFLELQGVLDIDGVLINVIKTVDFPS